MAKKALVTGGAGFIGINFVQYLLSEDYEVVVLDSFTYAANKEGLYSIGHPGLSVYVGDICDANRVRQVIANTKPDVVFHLAAESHVDRSIAGPQVFFQTNVFGTYTMVSICKELIENGTLCNEFKFVHVSTDEVFGSLDRDGYNAFDENSQINPSSPYSASKASSDHIVLSYCHTYGFPGVVTNCSNNYGPYQHPEKLVPASITKILNGEKVDIHGDGCNVRDWIYVDDHCKAIEAVYRSGRIGERYCIGGEEEKRNIEIVAEVVKRICGERCEALDYINFVTDRPGGDARYAIINRKITHHTGWRPTTNFEQGIDRTVAWYQRNSAQKGHIKQ